MRPRLPHLARLLPAALGLALALGATAARARAGAGPDAPRLEGAEGRSVVPGQCIALSWSGAGDVRELEILLSIDGGWHYTLQVSPQLGAGVTRFLWRVPQLPGADLRLRIRYNRDGREIEGPPSAVLSVRRGGGDAPEPLALPPAPEGPGERAPRPAPGGADARASLAEGESGSRERFLAATAAASTRLPRVEATHAPLPTGASVPAGRAPRFVPLRP